jgi:uncharacterized protein YecE (DUF72 family)
MKEWARKVIEFRDSGRDVFVFFNNDYEGHAIANARELMEFSDVEPLTAS